MTNLENSKNEKQEYIYIVIDIYEEELAKEKVRWIYSKMSIQTIY